MTGIKEKINIRRIWWREILFANVLFFERNGIPGAWRIRAWFEDQKYNSSCKGTVVCSTEYGVKMFLEPFDDNGVEKSIFQTGTYERGTLAVMLAVLKEGDHFVDIGANVGLMTLVAAKKVGATGRVDSFEPLSEIRSLLSNSIIINNIHNTHIHSVALGSSRSKMDIYRHPEVNRGSASIALSNASEMKSEIDVDTLDYILSQVSAQAVSMIKIDVEGWELEVLKGGAETLNNSPQPIVCIEFSQTHPLHGGTHQEMFQLMQSAGYSGYVLEKSKSTVSPLTQIDISHLPEHDNVFFIPINRIKGLNETLLNKV
jgi:FkbM family methyltransferase